MGKNEEILISKRRKWKRKGKNGKTRGEVDRRDLRWAGVNIYWGGLGRFLFGMEKRGNGEKRSGKRRCENRGGLVRFLFRGCATIAAGHQISPVMLQTLVLPE